MTTEVTLSGGADPYGALLFDSAVIWMQKFIRFYSYNLCIVLDVELIHRAILLIPWSNDLAPNPTFSVGR